MEELIVDHFIKELMYNFMKTRYHQSRRVLSCERSSRRWERKDTDSQARQIHCQRPEEVRRDEEETAHRWWAWVLFGILFMSCRVLSLKAGISCHVGVFTFVISYQDIQFDECYVFSWQVIKSEEVCHVVSVYLVWRLLFCVISKYIVWRLVYHVTSGYSIWWHL